MRLQIFAHQISCLAFQTGCFTLSPVEGLKIDVVVLGNGETVYLDTENCGNRNGAIQRFAELVGDYLTTNGLTLIP